jgi:hypothetical protein
LYWVKSTLVTVTTRPAGPAGSERVEVPGFAGMALLPMSREEVYVFIDRWCKAAEVSIQKDRTRAEEEAKRAAEDLKSRVQNSGSSSKPGPRDFATTGLPAGCHV